ncbi:MAG: hypothetical protein GVY19_02460 [Bacteroidetes bacterium]|jgi:hypothetical protein|nr:hypothetical protein [Bacteroidota bacterium]
MLKSHTIKLVFLWVLLFVVFGCATYYTKNLEFQQQFATGNIEEADNTLEKLEKKVKDKDRILYYLKKGVVEQMLGNYEKSNEVFEQAYFYFEDYRKKLATEALSLITNPAIKPYKGEDHEIVLLHYYKSINFIMMGRYDDALVECRRLNNKLNALQDRYEYKNYRYKSDAFVNNLMGIIYEANRDVNNAFIAYRNAYNTYKNVYAPNYNVSVPHQLKEDLLRTAYLNGFREELRQYEKAFSMNYEPPENKNTGDFVFFWHNGLGPVKDEWSINFAIQRGQGGTVMFVNDELGLSFPFVLSGDGSGSLSDLKFIRVAFPKYVERKPIFNSAYLNIDNKKVQLDRAQDINQIAFKSLEDRMLRELGTSLLRLALKQAAEAQVRKENQNLGMLVSIMNAVTEKADTRNWQTLPYSIWYTRIRLPEGDHRVRLNTREPGQVNEAANLNVNIRNNHTTFYLYHSLESYAPNISQ